MKLEWLSARWRPDTSDILIEGANDATPHVYLNNPMRSGAGTEDNVTARLAEQLHLALSHIAQYGDFHRAAIGYAKEHTKYNGLSAAMLEGTGQDPAETSVEATLRTEIGRLQELVGFYERSNTARLLGVAEPQLIAIRDVLRAIREKWETAALGNGVRRSVFGPSYFAIERWATEGFPLSETSPP